MKIDESHDEKSDADAAKKAAKQVSEVGPRPPFLAIVFEPGGIVGKLADYFSPLFTNIGKYRPHLRFKLRSQAFGFLVQDLAQVGKALVDVF